MSSIGIRTKLPLAQAITATAILHNIACENRDLRLDVEEVNIIDPPINNQENQPLDNAEITARASFVDHFAQLL